MRAVAFDLEVEHGGAANLREKLRKRANGHLHGQVFTLGGVEHAGDEFFLTARRLAPLPRPARFCTLSTLRSDMDVLLTLPREKSRGGRFAEMSRCPGGRRRGFFPFARNVSKTKRSNPNAGSARRNTALILPKTMFSGRTAPLKCSAFQRQSALEQHAYGRPGVDVVDALGEKAGHGNDLQLRAHVQTFTGRDRVGDDDLGEHRVVEPLEGGAESTPCVDRRTLRGRLRGAGLRLRRRSSLPYR